VIPTPQDNKIVGNEAEPPILLGELIDRCMGSVEVVNLLLGKFEALLPNEVRKIETMCAAADLEGIAATAHALKGAAGAMAAKKIQSIAGDLLALARERRIDGIAALLPLIRAEADRCLAYLPEARALSKTTPSGVFRGQGELKP
jgi:HPt (histidine-containing phosphotransfer) domain-containing protein